MAQGSSSKINLWNRCYRKAYYHDIKKLTRKRISIAPTRGTIIHQCLANLYSGTADWAEPIRQLKIDWENLFDEEREEWGNLPDELYRIMRGYILAYKAVDSKIKTLATEVEFKMPVGTNHVYHGTIDHIYEDTSGVWVSDTKTVKTIPDVNDLYADLQTMLYYKAVEEGHVQITTDKPLCGVVFNHIRTKAPTRPRILKDGSVSKAQCDTDLATYFETVRQQGLDVNDYADMVDKLKNNVFYRRARIPVPPTTIKILMREITSVLDTIDVKTNQILNSKQTPEDVDYIFPRTLIKGRCNWDCEYAKLCFGELTGQNVTGIIEDEYEQRELRYDDDDYSIE